MMPDSKQCICEVEDRDVASRCPIHGAPLSSASVLQREDGAAWYPWMALSLEDALDAFGA